MILKVWLKFHRLQGAILGISAAHVLSFIPNICLWHPLFCWAYICLSFLTVIYNLCEQKEAVRAVANYGIAVPPKSAKPLNFSPLDFPDFF